MGKEVNEQMWIVVEALLFPGFGPYFLLYANLSGAGAFAQSTIIAFHT